MKKLSFSRLIDKLTKATQNLNDSFIFQNHKVHFQSGTIDYVAVYVENVVDFSFDFWTKELVVNWINENYNVENLKNKLIEIYGSIK